MWSVYDIHFDAIPLLDAPSDLTSPALDCPSFGNGSRLRKRTNREEFHRVNTSHIVHARLVTCRGGVNIRYQCYSSHRHDLGPEVTERP